MAGRPMMMDNDQYNRIFIIGIGDVSTADIRKAFEQFGNITDVYMPRSKSSQETKGIAYVTFSKASEAALAIEEMNGKSLKDGSRNVKVVLANSKSQGNVRDVREDEKMLRLFIVIPPSFTDKDVENEFSKFGKIESIHVVKDRKSGSSRGLAYVRFSRAYDAAIALENCDSQYKPIFADSPKTRGSNSADGHHSYSSSASSLPRRSMDRDRDRDRSRLLEPPPIRPLPAPPAPAPGLPVMDMISSYSQQTETVLEAIMCPALNSDQVTRLFDIIPGLDTCHYDHNTGKALVKYFSPQAAAYARDKLNMFEYPPGYTVSVQLLARSRGLQDMTTGSALPTAVDTFSNVQNLVASLQQAMSVLQKAGSGGQMSGSSTGMSYSRGPRSPPGSYSHQGKRSYGGDDNSRSSSMRKSSRFS